VDIEQTLETQRLRLLRIVTGLFLLVEVLAVGPVSRRFSDWTFGFVGSVLSRSEAATRYLLITQTCLMVDSCGLGVTRSQITLSRLPEWDFDDVSVALPDFRQRLRALRAALLNLPRHALRVLRRIAKQMRRTPDKEPPHVHLCVTAPLSRWRQVPNRIERPPDKHKLDALRLLSPPPDARRGVEAVGP